MPAKPISLRARAIAALARREHSRTELARKLATHADSEAALTELLNELEAKNLLSSHRFVESRVRQRESKYGTARILAELQHHGVPAELVRQEAQRLRSSEFDRALHAWQRRFGQPPQTEKEKAQQLRFMLARGFTAETYFRIAAQSFSADHCQ
ncbi:MAG: recombination regulator RecX [Betaproteobacteria bacterium]|jgi:regulatory protein|nr:recombination regulator RecX [Betaproteobacteria bacterium]